MPGTDAKWIVGALGGLLLMIGGLLISRNAGLRADPAELRADVRRLDDRVRAVEISFGKVAQRLLTLERVMLPAAGRESAP